MQPDNIHHTETEKPLAHVYIIVVHLLLAGIVILFLGISYAYIFSDNQEKWEQFHLPKIFWLSTACVICISVLLTSTLRHYTSDNLKKLRLHFIAAAFFAILFLSFQCTGWLHMHGSGYTLADTPSSGYIYLLGWLHGLHILTGIVLLLVAIYKVQSALHDPVKKLLYLSDKSQYIRIKLLTHFWHTIDLLWIFIFCLFLYQHA